MQHSGRQRVEHSLVETPTQKSYEATTILAFDFGREVNVGAQFAVVSLELDVARRTKIACINTYQA
jgi:hypothetical protein